MSAVITDPKLLEIIYEASERRFQASLPPEHTMESTEQAHQRTMTLASFDLIHAQRLDIQMFNELLLQFPGERIDKSRPVCPDNTVVVPS